MINIKEVKFPTHFRFKNEEEADCFDTDTKKWHKIKEIQLSDDTWEISSEEFAWAVYFLDKPNLYFKCCSNYSLNFKS